MNYDSFRRFSYYFNFKPENKKSDDISDTVQCGVCKCYFVEKEVPEDTFIWRHKCDSCWSATAKTETITPYSIKTESIRVSVEVVDSGLPPELMDDLLERMRRKIRADYYKKIQDLLR